MAERKHIAVSTELYDTLDKVRAGAEKAAGRPVTFDEAWRRTLDEAYSAMDAVERLQAERAQDADDFTKMTVAMMTTLAVDAAARAEAKRLMDAGEGEAVPDIDHIGHWRSLSPEARASHFAIVRVRVEATTGINPLTLAASLPIAEGQMATALPEGMASDNAEANARMTAKLRGSALNVPAPDRQAE